MENELETIEKQNIWEVIDKPESEKVLDCKGF